MTTVSSGQNLYVSSGQTSSGVVILSGGGLYVLSGGTASDTTIDRFTAPPADANRRPAVAPSRPL